MRFDRAVDAFIADQRQAGRINSRHSEAAYRQVLGWHGEDVGNRDPAKTGREDVRKTLGRWAHARTRAQRHAILRSFYDWWVESVSPGPYVELFARRARFGWDYWGDQSLGTADMPGVAA